MTDKERTSMDLDKYFVLPRDKEKKATVKLLCKELRASLRKKGFQVEKDDLYYERMERHDDYRHLIIYSLDAHLEAFNIDDTDAIKRWKENDLSIYKTAKECKQFKSFVKNVKKDLRDSGYYSEPKEMDDDDLER